MATMKRRTKMTEEQQQAYEERRAKMRQLSKTIAAMSEADRQALAQQVGTVLTCGNPPRQLSPYNTCMLIHQREDVTIVGGLQQWRQVGRRVKKGEKGLYIWVPLGSKDEAPGAQSEGEEPNERRFRLVAVFDVGQTQEEAEQEEE